MIVREHQMLAPLWQAEHRRARREFHRKAEGTVILLVTAGALMGARFWNLYAIPDMALGAIASGAAAWAVYTVSQSPRRRHRRRLRTLQTLYNEDSPWLGEYIVRISERGVDLRVPAIAARYEGAAIRQIDDNPSGMVVNLVVGLAFMIPRSAFKDERSYVIFHDSARTWHVATGFGPAGRIRDYIETCQPPCPECGKPLIPSREAACSLCGAALTFESLPAAMGHMPRRVVAGGSAG